MILSKKIILTSILAFSWAAPAVCQENPLSGNLIGGENIPPMVNEPQLNLQVVGNFVNTLSDQKEQQVLKLTLEGKTPQEISHLLGLSMQAVQGILQSGIANVTKIMQDQGLLPPVAPEALQEIASALMSAQKSNEVQDVLAASLEGANESSLPEGTDSTSSAQIGDLKKSYKVNQEGDVVLDVLDLKNIDILDVLKLISQKSGVNIVAGQNVKGRVTVYLKDVGVEDALKIIVEAYGWAYAKEAGVIKVMMDKEYEDKYGHKFGQETTTKIVKLVYVKPPDMVPVLDQMRSSIGKIIADEKSNSLILLDNQAKLDEMQKIIEQLDVLVKTEIFELNYAKAEEVSEKVTELLTPGLGRMKFDKRSNRLVVSDTVPKIKIIEDLIQAFDRKDKQVLIEAKILQIVLSDEYKLGVDWEAIVTKYHDINLKNDFSILASGDKRGSLTVGTIESDRYSALVEALDLVGTTDILSSPRIAAMNNQEAKILVGSTEPYVTTTTTTPSSGPTTTAESVNFIEVGVKLFVTPTIHEDDFVTMKIKPEVSSVTRTVTTSTNNAIPVVETSEAETSVLVKNGVTVVIGGLIKEEGIKAVKKVPLFGDVPVIGWAFRNKSDKISKTEIVIFLTPQIISGDVQENKVAIKAQ